MPTRTILLEIDAVCRNAVVTLQQAIDAIESFEVPVTLSRDEFMIPSRSLTTLESKLRTNILNKAIGYLELEALEIQIDPIAFLDKYRHLYQAHDPEKSLLALESKPTGTIESLKGYAIGLVTVLTHPHLRAHLAIEDVVGLYRVLGLADQRPKVVSNRTVFIISLPKNSMESSKGMLLHSWDGSHIRKTIKFLAVGLSCLLDEKSQVVSRQLLEFLLDESSQLECRPKQVIRVADGVHIKVHKGSFHLMLSTDVSRQLKLIFAQWKDFIKKAA